MRYTYVGAVLFCDTNVIRIRHSLVSYKFLDDLKVDKLTRSIIVKI